MPNGFQSQVSLSDSMLHITDSQLIFGFMIKSIKLIITVHVCCFSVDNFSTAHNLTFSLSTIFNGTILDTVANPHYQFRIDLSPADHCHCLTVDSATGVIGNIIFNQWRDGSFWCGSNITQLCASSRDNGTFYSVLISQNGSLLRDDALLCDNSTDEATISETQYLH